MQTTMLITFVLAQLAVGLPAVKSQDRSKAPGLESQVIAEGLGESSNLEGTTCASDAVAELTPVDLGGGRLAQVVLANVVALPGPKNCSYSCDDSEFCGTCDKGSCKEGAPNTKQCHSWLFVCPCPAGNFNVTQCWDEYQFCGDSDHCQGFCHPGPNGQCCCPGQGC